MAVSKWKQFWRKISNVLLKPVDENNKSLYIGDHKGIEINRELFNHIGIHFTSDLNISPVIYTNRIKFGTTKTLKDGTLIKGVDLEMDGIECTYIVILETLVRSDHLWDGEIKSKMFWDAILLLIPIYKATQLETISKLLGYKSENLLNQFEECLYTAMAKRIQEQFGINQEE